MRDYAKVSPLFWTGETGKAIRRRGFEGLLVATYLMTNGRANMLGLYEQPVLFMAHETALGVEGASKGLQVCIEEGFCSFDAATEIVWVHEMARYQIADSLKSGDNRCKAVQREYDALPKSPFLGAFFDRYATAFHMTSRRDSNTPKRSPSEAPSDPLRSQEQEQEQEQEQLLPSFGGEEVSRPAGFERFWGTWPKNDRKGAKAKCLELWHKDKLERQEKLILAHVEAMSKSDSWTKQNRQFVPAPLVYLRSRQWDGAELEGASQSAGGVFEGAI